MSKRKGGVPADASPPTEHPEQPDPVLEAAPELPVAPAVEPEPEPAEVPPLPDAPAGFRVSRWHGHPNYECMACPFATLSPGHALAHTHP